MRVPLPWLREYCDPPLSTADVERRLTMTGTKVEAVHHHGVADVANFVVGHVEACDAHPDADRLRVCAVDVGAAHPATIVCGAPNVAAGQTVAVALPGAVLPDGTTLRPAKLRGIVSEGMILSETEIEVGAGDEGIIVLAENAAPGTPLSELLAIAADVLELEVTPNRPDCLGLYGVARELHAATGAPLAPAPWLADPGSAGPLDAVDVTVRCPDLCPRFTARVLEDVTVAPSPLWLQARLIAAGQRPISNVVDVTNYAMLLTGQPLHAFDLDRVEGAELTVRRAADGEQVTTLDGQTRTLDAGMVVIDDDAGPTSIAAIMGGERSEVHARTTRVVLEVANWDGPAIHRASSALGLRSEASSRFEKGLAPEQCDWAQAVACALLIELCGARLLPGTVDIDAQRPAPAPITLREQRVSAILGVDVERGRQAEILAALGFASEPVAEGLLVTVPPERRNDVTREVDLIEEVARIDGLEDLPARLPARRGAAGRLTHGQRVKRRAEDELAGRGLHEAVGWSFADPAVLDRLRLAPGDPLRDVVTLRNPLSESQSILRPTLLSSLLDSAAHNAARTGPDLALFESGTVFRATAAGLAEEYHELAALLCGALAPASWRGQAGGADFYSAKALLEGLFGALHLSFTLSREEWPFLHPGRSAAIEVADARLGWIGEVHPLVAGAWDLPGAAGFALDLDALAVAVPRDLQFVPFSPYPPLRRDIAVVLDSGTSAGDALAAIRGAAGDALKDARVFDVYEGEQVGRGHRSLAIALTFAAPDRTLADSDVDPAVERIVAALAELGGTLRG
ncbi:MAG TPA: phenylalanine--tRNA ligase subunit beta [Solirubrobacteraceae bacterium]|nr:phenylalanine--tRNA ligase subunit beta [Solirubrobacteraceae bacterium]